MLENNHVVLSIRSLKKSFNNSVVIDSFNLDIAQGEFICSFRTSSANQDELIRKQISQPTLRRTTEEGGNGTGYH